MKSLSLVLLIGSNVGDSKDYLTKAKIHLEKEFGKLILKSNIFKTQAWGITEQDDFLNQALVYYCNLNPEEILKKIKSIEKKIGRQKRNTWANREIDIDIIYYGSLIFQSEKLIIPHPLMHLRKFVLIPLSQIIPEFKHPVLNKSVNELLKNCNDNLMVEKTINE
ncbi:MAG: 2-amino-4-hydroxy-6-hydroxymethyldihydropteridine diphosphokinase [Bacteroidia bacterium]|nr:2-amino-4-hydroxy-6-hydroxymethyldihydropteridine diphosphokinase [Bacteroidia bacterium]